MTQPASPTLILCLLLGSQCVAVPPNVHDRHAFFENAYDDTSYFRSRATVIAPSELKFFNGRLPVDVDVFRSPPNSLRLSWKSAPGGDWRATIKAPQRTMRTSQFSGDTLALTCLRPTG